MTFVGKYDQGMKMLVKLSKNPNATLYSDIEEKGKGKRMKKPVKHFDDSEKENNPKKERNIQLPLLSQLTNAKKSSQSSQPLPNKVDKIKKSFIDKVSSSHNNLQKLISDAHEINVSAEISKNKDYTVYKGVKPKENSISMGKYKSKPATITSGRVCSSQAFSSNPTGCKICSMNEQKCAYTPKGEVTLESLANAICYLNGKLKIVVCVLM